MIWNHSIPEPPVPQGIREALKDHPNLILEIQERLNVCVDQMLRGSHFTPFEEALWALEGIFDRLVIDAGEILAVARASGDQQAVERAKAYRLLLGRTDGAHYWNEDGEGSLWDYFKIYKEAFE